MTKINNSNYNFFQFSSYINIVCYFITLNYSLLIYIICSIVFSSISLFNFRFEIQLLYTDFSDFKKGGQKSIEFCENSTQIGVKKLLDFAEFERKNSVLKNCKINNISMKSCLIHAFGRNMQICGGFLFSCEIPSQFASPSVLKVKFCSNLIK